MSRPRSRESSRRTGNAEPDLHGDLEQPSRARQPSRRSLTARAPETAATNCHRLADSAMQRNRPNSNARGRVHRRVDARDRQRTAGGRVPRAARRCRRRPLGRAAESAPVAPAGHADPGVIRAPRRFRGRARTSDRHAGAAAPPETHDLPTCRLALDRAEACRGLNGCLHRTSAPNLCTEPLHRPLRRRTGWRRHVDTRRPEHRDQVGASARSVRPTGVAERAPTRLSHES